jgi:hypothetical protein
VSHSVPAVARVRTSNAGPTLPVGAPFLAFVGGLSHLSLACITITNAAPTLRPRSGQALCGFQRVGYDNCVQPSQTGDRRISNLSWCIGGLAHPFCACITTTEAAPPFALFKVGTSNACAMRCFTSASSTSCLLNLYTYSHSEPRAVIPTLRKARRVGQPVLLQCKRWASPSTSTG